MEVKKNLNNTQRKVMHQIYLDRFNEIYDDKKSGFSKRKEEAKQKAVKAFEASKEYKNARKTIESSRKVAKELHANLKKSGLRIYNLDYFFKAIDDISIGGSYSSEGEDIPAVVKITEEWQEYRAKLQNAKAELEMKIWGMDGGYEQIEKEVLSVIKKFS